MKRLLGIILLTLAFDPSYANFPVVKCSLPSLTSVTANTPTSFNFQCTNETPASFDKFSIVGTTQLDSLTAAIVSLDPNSECFTLTPFRPNVSCTVSGTLTLPAEGNYAFDFDAQYGNQNYAGIFCGNQNNSSCFNITATPLVSPNLLIDSANTQTNIIVQAGSGTTSVTIKNIGAADLNNIQLTFTPSGILAVTSQPNCAADLAPNQSCTFTVNYIAGAHLLRATSSTPVTATATATDGFNDSLLLNVIQTSAGEFVNLPAQSASYQGLNSRNIMALSEITVNDSTELFAGTNGHGLWKSTDGGSTWMQLQSSLSGVSTDFSNTIISLIAVPNGDSFIFFAGTNGDGLWQSDDEGQSWTQVTSATLSGNSKITALAASVSDATTTLYVGTLGNGVWQGSLNDSGWTWTQLATNFNGVAMSQNVTALAVNNGVLYAGTFGAGIWQSTDGGNTWTIGAASLSGQADNSAYVVSLILGNSGLVYAGTNGSGIWRSNISDLSNWTQVKANLSGIPDDSANIAALLLMNSTLYAGTFGAGLWQSTNVGSSWSVLAAGLSSSGDASAYVTALLQAVNSGPVYVGTYGAGVWRSADGTTWTQLASNLNSAGNDNSNYVLSLSSDGTHLYAGTSGTGLWQSTIASPTSWTQIHTALGSPANSAYVSALTPDISSTMYAGTQGAGVWKTTNNGAAWAQLVTQLDNSNPITAFISALALDTSNNILYAGTGGAGLWQSTDGGVNWSVVPNYTAQVNQAYVSGIATPIVNGSTTTLYVGTAGSGVWKGVDTSGTWVWTQLIASFNNTLGSQYASALLLTPLNAPTTLWVGSYGAGLWSSFGNTLPTQTMHNIRNTVCYDQLGPYPKPQRQAANLFSAAQCVTHKSEPRITKQFLKDKTS